MIKKRIIIIKKKKKGENIELEIKDENKENKEEIREQKEEEKEKDNLKIEENNNKDNSNKKEEEKENINKEEDNQKIFEEKKETETIKILMMTYRDILDYVRDNDLDYFLNQIKEKEIKNRKNKNENINKYMNLVKELLNDYENWFLRKNGRNSDKK